MRVLYHPEFPKDIRRIEAQYAEISDRLASRFRGEIDQAVEAIKAAPESAGHFPYHSSVIVREVGRRNLRAFPFFILYGLSEGRLMFGAIIASRSDPALWFARFQNPPNRKRL